MASPKGAPVDTALRRRTRKAIVAATAELLRQGRTPTVAQVAEAAEVSRRTVYLYFPTLEQLLIDAALVSVTRETVDAALDAVADSDDVEVRVDAMVRAVQRLFVSTEQQGRTLLRLTVDSATAERATDQPIRGYRRIEWIERALEPARARLSAPAFERLVSSLAMVIGWEALIVERDIRALSLEEAEDVSAWAARALVRASLDEAKLGKGRAAVTSVTRRAPRRTRSTG